MLKSSQILYEYGGPDPGRDKTRRNVALGAAGALAVGTGAGRAALQGSYNIGKGSVKNAADYTSENMKDSKQGSSSENSSAGSTPSSTTGEVTPKKRIEDTDKYKETKENLNKSFERGAREEANLGKQLGIAQSNATLADDQTNFLGRWLGTEDGSKSNAARKAVEDLQSQIQAHSKSLNFNKEDSELHRLKDLQDKADEYHRILGESNFIAYSGKLKPLFVRK
jgi:hypothetical protein